MADLDDPAIAAVRDTSGRCTLAIHGCRKPVMAALNGSAVGIAATMTLAMDRRLMSASARIGLVFGRLELAPRSLGSPVRSFLSLVNLGAAFFDGALWARSGRALNRGGWQRGADATRVAGAEPGGQQLFSAHERRKTHRFALTLRTIGVFPMTHHVECVALLTR